MMSNIVAVNQPRAKRSYLVHRSPVPKIRASKRTFAGSKKNVRVLEKRKNIEHILPDFSFETEGFFKGLQSLIFYDGIE